MRKIQPALGTPDLAAALERVSRAFPGFHFGRYDVRAPSEQALRAGEFQVLELNGLTSESTHVYDPRHSVLTAWRDLARQWRLAFEIGAANARAGARIPAWRKIVPALRRHRRRSCAAEPAEKFRAGLGFRAASAASRPFGVGRAGSPGD